MTVIVCAPAGTGKLHKPVRFEAELDMQRGWLDSSSTDFRGAHYQLVTALVFRTLLDP